jgi:hypothetical protein
LPRVCPGAFLCQCSSTPVRCSTGSPSCSRDARRVPGTRRVCVSSWRLAPLQPPLERSVGGLRSAVSWWRPSAICSPS